MDPHAELTKVIQSAFDLDIMDAQQLANINCYNCSKKGRFSRNCKAPKLRKPKPKHDFKSNVQSSSDDDDDESESGSSSTSSISESSEPPRNVGKHIRPSACL